MWRIFNFITLISGAYLVYVLILMTFTRKGAHNNYSLMEKAGGGWENVIIALLTCVISVYIGKWLYDRDI
jgi:threonine/homoserine/homoserine lactone efflux protein